MQRHAFEYADAPERGQLRRWLRFFSAEHPTSGKRSFIAASAHKFFERYMAVPAEQRHHYEVGCLVQ